MRSIKFRGKRVDNGEWVYGSLHYRTTDCEKSCFKDGANNYSLAVMTMPVIEVYEEKHYDLLCDYPVIPETVGQFTGLTDKNGKEIYEGDIVQWCDYKMLIVWDEIIGHGFGFQWLPINHERRESITGFIDEYKVISNIHDNPELMDTNL